jgi:hypothetical protein
MEEDTNKMKHNLKTFPDLVADPTTNEQQIIEWKEGFEKELTEMLSNAEFDNPKSPILKIQNKIRIELLQEILGEDKE